MGWKEFMPVNVVDDNNDVNDYFVLLRFRPPMEQSRPYHHGNLRQALLEQAMVALRDGGIDELSLRELARAVGVSHAAPRRHFPDRQALLDALAIEGFARLGADLRDAAANGDPEFEPTLQRCAHAYVTFAITDAALLEVMFAGKHTETVDEAAALSFAPILELILRGQAEHILEDGDPERVGLMLLSVIHGIASLRSAGMLGPDQLEWLVDDAIVHFLRGSRAVVSEGVDVA
jgi:AcrR family transcriptional regulator